jgi:hypothetical protein
MALVQVIECLRHVQGPEFKTPVPPKQSIKKQKSIHNIVFNI